LDDYALATYLDHYWAYDINSFARLIKFIANRPLQIDKLIALRKAFLIYKQAGKPNELLCSLHEAVAGNQPLRTKLELLINPPVSENMRKSIISSQERSQKRDEIQLQRARARINWMSKLRANPDRIYDFYGMNKGEITNNICNLIVELRNMQSAGFCDYANWKLLIPEFGEPVALAYRTTAIFHWRLYRPALRSEGVQTRDHTYSFSLANAGLEIEAAETENFPNNLMEPDVRHALRYITWHSNGLPRWLEQLHRVFPDLVKEAVLKELVWELENPKPETRMHYILSPLVYHGRWLHGALAPDLLQWVAANPTALGNNRNHCLQILVNGGIEPARLAAVASQQIAQANDQVNLPGWYALLVDCEPTTGIPQAQQWLEDLSEVDAIEAAQLFIVELMGKWQDREGKPFFILFHTAYHLKTLYLMMLQYIRVKDDTVRINGLECSIGLRDYAQSARNLLFDLLSQIPGKSSYTAITELIEEHPVPAYQNHFKSLAYRRAEEDSDIEAWSVEQLIEFEQSLTITPETHRQLFELVVHRLDDLKSWLERGNDSPWQTWQRVERETEMRTLIADWLSRGQHLQFTIAQEAELANAQRPDFWVQCPKVDSPVPIELKLLEKWSGPQLCERLRNQLVGDYLREQSAKFGVMLLVWRGIDQPHKRWEIKSNRVELNELANALKLYWNSIADEYPDADDIAVIVIDLTMRSQVSDS
jgi:hypothetical protein